MAFEDPSKDVQDDWLEILDIIFLVLYTIEMFLKVFNYTKCTYLLVDIWTWIHVQSWSIYMRCMEYSGFCYSGIRLSNLRTQKCLI